MNPAPLMLPTRHGTLEPWTPAAVYRVTPPDRPASSRVAYAAVHVVADPLPPDPGEFVSLDWDATLAFRRHIWSCGLLPRPWTPPSAGWAWIGPPLAREIFRAPTRHYKVGVVFLAYLAGHQDHFRMVGGLESARSIVHLADALRLADAAGVLPDPDLAVARMRPLLEAAGIR